MVNRTYDKMRGNNLQNITKKTEEITNTNPTTDRGSEGLVVPAPVVVLFNSIYKMQIKEINLFWLTPCEYKNLLFMYNAQIQIVKQNTKQ